MNTYKQQLEQVVEVMTNLKEAGLISSSDIKVLGAIIGRAANKINRNENKINLSRLLAGSASS